MDTYFLTPVGRIKVKTLSFNFTKDLKLGTYFPFRRPARSTSATLSGNFLFKVSGSIKEKPPAENAATPKITTGMPAWTAP